MINILICLLFKNSNLWLDDFMNCINDLLLNKPENVNYDLSVIYGDSSDGTDENLESILLDIHDKYKITMQKIYVILPNRLDGIQKLVLLRNSFLNINQKKLDKYKYLLIIDTDVMFRYNTILKMIQDIENIKLNAGVVAPLIFINNYRNYGNKFFYDTFAYRLNEKMFSHYIPYIPYIPIQNDILVTNRKRIIEVDSVGSIYIIKSDIFINYDVMYGTYERNKSEPHPQRKFESEQVILCDNIRKKTSYKIYVDLNLKVYHVNLEKYGLAWH